ncbi:uncharacterized protein PHACADRAFT_190964 [Phanerochaete carnosa HHB-10118-sp]|uniref:carboxypeptidase C n=1 Tax=Phanerochaete carnosa (strain HHB-10118-sp) TaxID=650164 RepID=K5WQM1_PHACS|nr:uncharacterized protein PHACADRAFT_190964 [Phanerochaete carnosa HHB-10118-sp]EKM61775.1 hypothetical protein PHACADRAFT_190964 [Phanerochaete carnosa HHB-10118-sp]
MVLLKTVGLSWLALCIAVLGVPHEGQSSQSVLQPGVAGFDALDGAVQQGQVYGVGERIESYEVTSVFRIPRHLERKHLFSWFFEARHDPENAPLMLWLNGGPGARTIASGLLFEHGPYSVPVESITMKVNKHSWNEKVNIIYLDQPVGTGYSYGSATTLMLATLAEDVYAFLQLWMHRFPRYAARPFHLAGESWSGHYVPHIAHLIHTSRMRRWSVANGLTDPAAQFETNVEYMCGGAPYPPFRPDDPRCAAWRAATPVCLSLVRSCYKFPSNATCDAATTHCWTVIQGGPLEAAKKNPYDLRKECPEDQAESMCYPEVTAGVAYPNQTSTKLALGVDPGLDFKVTTNYDVNLAFYALGQAMLNSQGCCLRSSTAGSGCLHGVCNYMGIERWMSRLEHDFHAEFDRAPTLSWKMATGEHAGNVRVAGPGAGNVTFVRMFEAGHLAPYDQPEASLDMTTRWIDNRPFFWLCLWSSYARCHKATLLI